MSQTTNILPDNENGVSDQLVSQGAIKTISLTSGYTATANRNAGVYFLYADGNIETSGIGRGFRAELTVAVDGSVSISITDSGRLFAANDTITIDESNILGSDTTDIVLTVLSVRPGSTTKGYKTVSLKSMQPIMKHTANSGRTIKVSDSYHSFEAKVSYNKLLKADFNRIYTFLLSRQGTLKAFNMALPQHQPVTYSGTKKHAGLLTSKVAGETSLDISMRGGTTLFMQAPIPEIGNIFTIYDKNNSTHTKAYMIVGVRLAGEQLAGESGIGTYNAIIDIHPPLQKDILPVVNGSGTNPLVQLELQRPLMRVALTQDSINYSVDSSGLYQLSFSVREDLI